MSFKKIITYGNLVALFAFFMPISEKISVILIFICILALAVEVYFKKVKLNINRELYVLPIIFIIYSISIIAFSNDLHFKWFEQRASLIAFPLIFLGSNNIDFKKVLKLYVYGCIVAYIICLVHALIKAISFGNGIEFNPLINPDRGFFEAVIYEGNYFFGTHFSFLIQTSYFAMYSLLAICSLLIYNKKFPKKTVYFGCFFLIMGILQTMSIAGILSTGGLFFLGIFFFIKKIKYKLVFASILISAIIFSFLFHPRLKMLKDSLYYIELKKDYSKSNPKIIRIVNWQSSLAVIRRNYLFGVGLCNAQNYLNAEYENRGFPKFAEKKLNSHNQFFQILLECGIIGLILLIIVLFQLAKKSTKLPQNEKLFAICFLIIICFNFLFESMLNRYIGISFFSFFVCLIYKITLNTKG